MEDAHEPNVETILNPEDYLKGLRAAAVKTRLAPLLRLARDIQEVLSHIKSALPQVPTPDIMVAPNGLPILKWVAGQSYVLLGFAPDGEHLLTFHTREASRVRKGEPFYKASHHQDPGWTLLMGYLETLYPTLKVTRHSPRSLLGLPHRLLLAEDGIPPCLVLRAVHLDGAFPDVDPLTIGEVFHVIGVPLPVVEMDSIRGENRPLLDGGHGANEGVTSHGLPHKHPTSPRNLGADVEAVLLVVAFAHDFLYTSGTPPCLMKSR